MSKIFQEAFNETLDKFGLKAVWLAEKTGVSNQGISRLRTGERDIYLQTFGKLFEALPIEAKQFFLEKLLGDAIAQTISLPKAIDRLNPEKESDRRAAAEAFKLIGEKFIYPSLGTGSPQSRVNTDETRQLELLKSP
jgi:transcriptional regulator with XRE-family HTH domain